MANKGIYIFIGPPYSGKETQTTPLSQELGIPVFSMGQLIRDARKNDQEVENAFQKYAKKGLHLPIGSKFKLLEEKMNKFKDGFILDNFPASSEDLDALNIYFDKNDMKIDKVFYLKISNKEIFNRFRNSPDRGRLDDTMEAITTRSKVQAEDRKPVLEYYRLRGLLVEINGERSIEEVKETIHQFIL